MQTFLPYPDYAKTAAILDNRRLGKQRVETLQIMKSLTNKDYGWKNHPAVKMWVGYEKSLLDYQFAICNEWTNNRGFKDTCYNKTLIIFQEFYSVNHRFINNSQPLWISNKEFHMSHQSNLIRKDTEFYGKVFLGIPNNLPYIWPVK